ncbi:high light inducible protein [Gloeobacter kilaueensis]|uniref:High light inducible protein n=1 Tax=Gloeobacter kilaueensis (strain ATCC BAA-2537 / CCAP 1431/1 / ULC 316 / JS1) TaxID=1183438 RepID=U5QGZ5_GLOK1|nr:high light inducible protein [Gloeobacter kilaueensis]AGY56874.1 high light inducible protein [Gloeobacter kilaueensis JS1]
MAAPEDPPQKSVFGFTPFAEQLNGRLAMIGFIVTLIIEAQTGHSLLHWLGLS